MLKGKVPDGHMAEAARKQKLPPSLSNVSGWSDSEGLQPAYEAIKMQWVLKSLLRLLNAYAGVKPWIRLKISARIKVTPFTGRMKGKDLTSVH